jgi:hypothetical protein
VGQIKMKDPQVFCEDQGHSLVQLSNRDGRFGGSDACEVTVGFEAVAGLAHPTLWFGLLDSTGAVFGPCPTLPLAWTAELLQRFASLPFRLDNVTVHAPDREAAGSEQIATGIILVERTPVPAMPGPAAVWFLAVGRACWRRSAKVLRRVDSLAGLAALAR